MTPYGKFMGSTVSPDGRFLAATANDRSVSLQIFDLETYQLIWRGGTAAGVNLRLSDNTVGQEGPLYSPDGSFLFMPNATGITRFPVNADGSLAAGTKIAIPDANGRRALDGRDGVLRRTDRPCTPPSTARTPWWRSTRLPARSSRPGTSASLPAS